MQFHNLKLKINYFKEVAPKLAAEFDIKNKLAVPRVIKVVVNMGIGDTLKSKELLESARKDMATITGQIPSTRAARVSVASFSIRRGMPVGLKVTLRGDRMYAFLDRLFSIVLPRLRDFRGLTLKSFDKFGNYNLGVREHTVFPEVSQGKNVSRGLEITLVTNSNNKEKSKRLLELMGMPFEKVEDAEKDTKKNVKDGK